MSKWIWLGLFFVTLAVAGWYGMRGPEKKGGSGPNANPSTGTKAPGDNQEEVIEQQAIVYPQVPLTPNLIRPPEPVPYSDIPPNIVAPAEPDYIPPPLYGAPPSDSAYPPPVQADPSVNGEPQTYGDTGEPIPQYLRPQPGSSPEEIEAAEAAADNPPPPSPFDEEQ